MTKWVGRCGECQSWGSVAEAAAPATRAAAAPVTTPAVPIGQVSVAESGFRTCGVPELDRVLGGGLIPGAAILLAGEPGVGKSTLLLEVAARWASAGRRTLYVTGEESAAQVRLRAGRTNAVADELYLAAETDLGTVLGHIEDVRPSLMVLDSIQTIGTTESDGAPGGVSQVREVAAALTRVAKQRGMAVIIVGHVTKDGQLAGPRTLEHLVDVVLAFEGDRHSGFRMVRASKNRYGPADEVGCFEMAENGIVEVTDPSGLFISTHDAPVPGTCVTVTMEGRRPLLAEIQALVSPSPQGAPARRVTQGIESARLAMVLAVLEKRAKIPVSSLDVYVSTVGGAKISEPAADLAVAAAVASAYLDTATAERMVAFGEIGLAGELRRVPGVDRRVAEARRLGSRTAITPKAPETAKGGTAPKKTAGIDHVEVGTVQQALAVLGLNQRLRSVS